MTQIPTGALAHRFGWSWLIADEARGGASVFLGLSGEEERWWRTGAGSDAAGRGCVARADHAGSQALRDRIRREQPDWLCVWGAAGAVKTATTELAGLAHRRRYAMLPPVNPRVLIPLASADLVEESLGLHRPGRWWAHAGVAAAAWLSRAGTTFLLDRQVLLIAAGRDTALHDAGHEHAVYLGTADEDRKTVALHFGSGTARFISKTAVSPSARTALRREAEMLQSLARTPLAGRVPRCLALEETGRRLVLTQEYRRRRNVGPSTARDAAAAFLAQLARLRASSTSLPNWLDGHALHEQHAPGLAALIHANAAGRVVRQCLGHGDFAPWNCMWTDGGLFVFDWESAAPDALAFGDAFHFAIAHSLHVAAHPNARRCVAAALRWASEVARRAGLPPEEAPLQLALWLLSRSKPDPLVLEMAAELERNWSWANG